MRIQINARNRAFDFDAAPGETHPLRGTGARINLPYECGSGTCGTCKARLVDGRNRRPVAAGAGPKVLSSAPANS